MNKFNQWLEFNRYVYQSYKSKKWPVIIFLRDMFLCWRPVYRTILFIDLISVTLYKAVKWLRRVYRSRKINTWF